MCTRFYFQNDHSLSILRSGPGYVPTNRRGRTRNICEKIHPPYHSPIVFWRNTSPPLYGWNTADADILINNHYVNPLPTFLNCERNQYSSTSTKLIEKKLSNISVKDAVGEESYLNCNKCFILGSTFDC